MTEERKLYEVHATGEFKPAPQFLHASQCLREMAATEGLQGRLWAGLGSLIVLAFAVEGFCNTYGEQFFGEDWKNHEREPPIDKLRLIGAKAHVRVDFGRQPWQDVKKLLQLRNELAHPRPAELQRTKRVRLTDEEANAVFGSRIALHEWEDLAEPPRAEKLEANVRAALERIVIGFGLARWELELMGTGGYTLTKVK